MGNIQIDGTTLYIIGGLFSLLVTVSWFVIKGFNSVAEKANNKANTNKDEITKVRDEIDNVKFNYIGRFERQSTQITHVKEELTGLINTNQKDVLAAITEIKVALAKNSNGK